MAKNEVDQGNSKQNPITSAKSILIVDDNLELLSVQKTLLEMEGHQIFTAQNKKQALEIIPKIERDLSLILLDMQLGQNTGDDVLSSIRQSFPDLMKQVPVVFLTGMDDVHIGDAQGIIYKGCHIDQYIKTINKFANPELSNQ